MDTQIFNVYLNWHNYKVDILVWHLLDALLDHMVAVLVKYALKNGIFEFTHQKNLLLQTDVL